MRTWLVGVGGACLVLGIAMFAAGGIASAQATTAFAGCLNTPQPTLPTACGDAMGSLILWGTVMDVGIVLGVLGLVLLILGLVLQPEASPPPAPYAYPYSPPWNAPYVAPPAPAVREEPKNPPPGPP